jgi:putative membrane protein
MLRLATLLGLVGLAVAIGLIAWQGTESVLAALATGGIGLIWAGLFHVVPMAINGRAWQALMPGAGRPSLAVFTWLVWIREAVNGLLPVARIGGELVSARLLIANGQRVAPSVASLVVDMTISLASQFLFTLFGLALMVFETGDFGMGARILLGLLVTVPLIVALFVVQRIGLFATLARAVRLLFGDRWSDLVGNSARLDRAVAVSYRRTGRVVRCLVWQLVGWAAGAGEIWLALRYLGHPASASEALIIEALIQAVSSTAFLVPAAIGVQEGGFMVLGGLLGLAPEIALALALARRVRDIVVFTPALAWWQLVESLRWLRAARLTRSVGAGLAPPARR